MTIYSVTCTIQDIDAADPNEAAIAARDSYWACVGFDVVDLDGNKTDVELPDAETYPALQVNADLLAALEALVACHRGFSGSDDRTVLDDEARAAAEAAIAAAKGESI